MQVILILAIPTTLRTICRFKIMPHKRGGAISSSTVGGKESTMEQIKTIEELLSGDFSLICEKYRAKEKSNRILKSTKIEQAIYEDLHKDAEELAEYERLGNQKLKTFDSLVNDIFQSVYGIKPKYTDETEISALAGKFNRNILDSLMSDETYSAIKSVCEGKELPAIGATEEFTGQILNHLDTLMEKATGGKGKVDALDKLEQDTRELVIQLSKLFSERETARKSQRESLDRKMIKIANRVLAKQEQRSMYENLIENNMRKNASHINAVIAASTSKALERAQEIQTAVMAWGDGSSDMKKTPVNTEVLKRIAASHKLRYIAKFLGRYKELLYAKRLAGYTYSRGEKYDIEYGNNITKALTSEIALLAKEELIPLFIRKYQQKALKQYRKREAEYKGKGDMIVCLDESGSTFGENNAYGMAIAMVLYEICRINRTNFALIHFSDSTKIDVFPKNEKVPSEIILECAETFLGGGTNFDHPLREMNSLMLDGRVEKPDIVFITDGICDVSDETLAAFTRCKTDMGAKLTGILLDKGSNIDFTLNQFADRVYRTSEFLEDDMIEKLIDERI